MSVFRLISAIGAAAVLVLGVAGCSRVGYSNQVSASTLSCDQASASAIQHERLDAAGSTIDRELQYLADNCPDAYEITIDYLSSRARVSPHEIQSCADWSNRIRAEAVELLRVEGLCQDALLANGAPPATIADGLSWDAAAEYVGTEQRVCGPITTIRTDDDDVFLNLGRDYPDPARFTIIIWDVGEVERLPAGTELCATGLVSSYDGVAQIELSDIGAVEVWE